MTADVVESFEPNGCFRVLSGRQYFSKGQLTFPDSFPLKSHGFYRTHFGFGTAHSGVIYARNNHNLSLALRRLTGCRLPDQPGEEARLQANNHHHFTTTLTGVLDTLKKQYATHFEGYLGMREEARLHHADPHPKRLLRINAYNELVNTGRIATRHWARCTRAGVPFAEAKMKTEEYAKPGKKPRMIVDLGVAASLQGFRLTEFLKRAQSAEPFRYKGGEIEFIKDPSPETLQRVFDKLISPPGRFYYCYFSDDACLAVRDGAIVRRYNLDISSCDASHTGALFDALIAIMPQHCADDMRVLVEQCSYALKIRNTLKPKQYVVIRPKTPRLYSGSTITTAINNLANLGIACAIVDAAATTPEAVIAAADSAGYIVTVDVCNKPDDLQFLKHSPAVDITGVYRPLLNLGVLLRLSGTCKRDLPGQGPVRARAEEFQSALLAGVYAGATFPLLTKLRSRLPRRVRSAVQQRVTSILMDRTAPNCSAPTAFTDDSVATRYFTDTKHLAELQTFARVGYLEVLGNEAIAAILRKDYGLDVRQTIHGRHEEAYPIPSQSQHPKTTP